MSGEAGTDQPGRVDIARIGDLAGQRAVGFRRAIRGYTPAEHWIVALADGSSVFAKIGVDRLTSDSLRTEQRVYAALQGEFMPQVRAWDDGERPLLLLEDLSDCRWPPPWDAAGVDRVLAALASAGRRPGRRAAAAECRRPRSRRELAAGGGRLGLATARLHRSASELIDAAERALLDGPCPAHQDVRSDNLCFREGRALLVDWNLAVLAHPDGIAFWLPSLHAEGGPAPEEILPAAAPLAAVISGFFAERAGKPPIPTAPGVRRVQREQLRTALPWAARALGLAARRSRRVRVRRGRLRVPVGRVPATGNRRACASGSVEDRTDIPAFPAREGRRPPAAGWRGRLRSRRTPPCPRGWLVRGDRRRGRRVLRRRRDSGCSASVRSAPHDSPDGRWLWCPRATCGPGPSAAVPGHRHRGAPAPPPVARTGR